MGGHFHPEFAQRADSLLNNADYDLLENNCEHFATWCVTGEKESNQVDRFLTVAGSAILGITTAGIATLASKNSKKNSSARIRRL